MPCVAVLLLVPGGVEHGRAAAGPAAVTAGLLLVVLDRDHGLDGVVPEGGGADGRAAEVAGLVAGERGDAQEGEGPAQAAAVSGSGSRQTAASMEEREGRQAGPARRHRCKIMINAADRPSRDHRTAAPGGHAL